MKVLTTMALAALLGAGLAGCGNSSSGGGGLVSANSMPQIAATAANNDPLVPNDSAQVVGSIETLFGTTADEPVNVLAGESVNQMITRLGG